MIFGAFPEDHQIDVLTIARWRREMHFVQQRATAHGNLGLEEAIVENCRHAPAQYQILLDLTLAWPRNRCLVGQNIPTGEWRHIANSGALLRIRQRWTTWAALVVGDDFESGIKSR